MADILTRPATVPADETVVLDTGVPGLVAFGATFETLIDVLQRSIGRLSADNHATRIGVPP